MIRDPPRTTRTDTLFPYTTVFRSTGKAAYRERAGNLASAFSGELTRNFFPLATLLNAAEMLLSAQQVVIVGARGAADTDALLRKVTERCLPTRIPQVLAAGDALPDVHPAAVKGQGEDQAPAYLSPGTVSSMPMTHPA